MNKPNVLLFDIDNTLLDFSAGAMQAKHLRHRQ